MKNKTKNIMIKAKMKRMKMMKRRKRIRKIKNKSRKRERKNKKWLATHNSNIKNIMINQLNLIKEQLNN